MKSRSSQRSPRLWGEAEVGGRVGWLHPQKLPPVLPGSLHTFDAFASLGHPGPAGAAGLSADVGPGERGLSEGLRGCLLAPLPLPARWDEVEGAGPRGLQLGETVPGQGEGTGSPSLENELRPAPQLHPIGSGGEGGDLVLGRHRGAQVTELLRGQSLPPPQVASQPDPPVPLLWAPSPEHRSPASSLAASLLRAAFCLRGSPREQNTVSLPPDEGFFSPASLQARGAAPPASPPRADRGNSLRRSQGQ